MSRGLDTTAINSGHPRLATPKLAAALELHGPTLNGLFLAFLARGARIATINTNPHNTGIPIEISCKPGVFTGSPVMAIWLEDLRQ